MLRKKLWMLIPVLVTAWGCVELVEPQMFKWKVAFDFPITSQSVQLGEYLDDPLIQEKALVIGDETYEGGYVFMDSVEIPEQSVGDQFSVNDMEPQQFNQNVEDVKVAGTNKKYGSGFDTVGVAPVLNSVSSVLGPIELANTTPSTPPAILFSDIFPDLGSSGNATITQSTPIPKPIYRDVTLNEIDEATFISGQLNVTIDNDLVIDLGMPLDISILNAGLDSTLIAVSNTPGGELPIAANGGAGQKVIDLAGKTLPSNFIVKVEGVVSGSGDQTIDLALANSSSFTLEVQAVGLVVSSATAQVQEQVIDTTDVILLAESDNKVARARIMEGNLGINIDNKLDLDAVLDLYIPSIDTVLSEEIDTFHMTVQLPKKTFVPALKDLNNFYLVMDVADQKVNYSYRIRTIDTGSGKATITENDGVDVEIKLYGLDTESDMTFRSFRGLVSQEPIQESGEIDISSDSRISNAILSAGAMNITITNNVNNINEGVPQLDLQIPQLEDPNGNPISENVALLPGENLIQIDLRDYKLTPETDASDPNAVKQFMTYSTNIDIPSDVIGGYNLTDSILVDIDVTELTFSEVTGFFDQDAMTDENVIELDTDVMIDQAVLETGQLKITVVNNIGVLANVNFTVNELLAPSGSSLTKTINLTESSDPVETVIPLIDYVIDLDPVAEGEKQSLTYQSVIALPSDREMTLVFGQDIDVTVEITDLNFKEVTGAVDSVTIDIEPISQAITALPEEMKGLNFWAVDMALILDTEITIPLYLELEVIARNSDGETEVISVNDRLLPGEPFMIPGAERLINLFPDSIIASGRAIADGNGSIKSSDVVKGRMDIQIPLVFNIDEDVTLEIDPEYSEGVDIPDELESATLNAVVFSAFDFGVMVNVLAATDSSYFDAGGPMDTIASLNIPAKDSSTQVLVMDADILTALSEGRYIKNEITLMGNGAESKILSTDSLTVKLFGTIEAFVDTEPDSTEEGGAM